MQEGFVTKKVKEVCHNATLAHR